MKMEDERGMRGACVAPLAKLSVRETSQKPRQLKESFWPSKLGIRRKGR
jgi:hypothetical protein